MLFVCLLGFKSASTTEVILRPENRGLDKVQCGYANCTYYNSKQNLPRHTRSKHPGLSIKIKLHGPFHPDGRFGAWVNTSEGEIIVLNRLCLLIDIY